MVFAPRLATLRSKRWDFQLSTWAAAGLPGSHTRPKRQMTENSNPRVDFFFALTSSAPFRLCSASSLCRPGYCEASSATCQLKVGYWQFLSPIEIMLCDLRTIPDELPSSVKQIQSVTFPSSIFGYGVITVVGRQAVERNLLFSKDQREAPDVQRHRTSWLAQNPFPVIPQETALR